MKSKISVLFLGIIFSYLSTTYVDAFKKDFNLCPNEDIATYRLGAISVDFLPQVAAGLIRRIRMPEFGLYSKTITCFLATDTSMDYSGGDVEILEGGIGHRYIEIRLSSKIGKGLDYIILTYGDRDAVNGAVQNMTLPTL